MDHIIDGPELDKLRRWLPYAKQIKVGVPRAVVESKLSAMGLAAGGLEDCLKALEEGRFELREGVGMDPTEIWESFVAPRQAVHRPVESCNHAAAPPPGHTRFVIISDTHGLHRDMPAALPDGHVLLHCGDFSNTGEAAQVADVVRWMAEQPHPHKLLIAGNHDTSVHREYYESRGRRRFHGAGGGYDVDAVRKTLLCGGGAGGAGGVQYLEDSGAVVRNFLIWGSPWSPEFCDWAFNVRRGRECQAVWARIPERVDVLLTHGPCLGHGDLCSSGHRAGCEDLLRVVQSRLSRCRLHACGHVHEGYGISTDGRTLFANASTCTHQYRPSNPPLVVDLPTPSDEEGAASKRALAEHAYGGTTERSVEMLVAEAAERGDLAA